MKILIPTILAFAFMFTSTLTFSQSGEMDRFSYPSLETKVNVVSMFPNPTTDYLSVRIEESKVVKARLTVHNIIGNVMDVDVEKVSDNEFNIKVKDLAPGYYLLAIRDDQGYFKETYKFLKR